MQEMFKQGKLIYVTVMVLFFSALISGCTRKDKYDYEGEGAFITVVPSPSGSVISDYNIYIFDLSGARLLGQRYNAIPSSELRFPELHQGETYRIAVVGNIGECRLPSTAAIQELNSIMYDLDTLSAASLHKEGAWIMASSRLDKDMLVEIPSYPTDTSSVGHVKLHLSPAADRIGLRVDATSLLQWSANLYQVKVIAPEGKYLPWTRAFLREGARDYILSPTEREFVSLQQAMLTRQRSPAVYFFTCDGRADESNTRIEVTVMTKNRATGIVMQRTFVTKIKDLLSDDWAPGQNIFATLVLNDGEASLEGQWSSMQF